jgi:hypothetical protein
MIIKIVTYILLIATINANAQRTTILIIADDLSADYFGFFPGFGDTVDVPNIRYLANNGIVFTNHMSNPVCSSTRTSILTGRYSFRTGVGGIVGGIGGSNQLDTAEVTIPKLLKMYCCTNMLLFTTSFLEAITGCDTMYHESTYLEIDESKATIRFHSTAKQAAQLAVLAKTKKLLLGHYSSKYRDVRVFEEEARSIFPNTFATIEGVTYEV